MSCPIDRPRLRQLSALAGELEFERDPDLGFDSILAAGREMTGARYAALGVLNEQRTGLERFHVAGVDDEVHRAIGAGPCGRGVLGVLILDPQRLRINDVTTHPSCYGFPEDHPAMRSFLGVPITMRGEVWGNLYLAETQSGAFTEADEEVAVALATSAAAVIETTRMDPAFQYAAQTPTSDRSPT
jgi:GAF domain-containing protein